MTFLIIIYVLLAISFGIKLSFFSKDSKDGSLSFKIALVIFASIILPIAVGIEYAEKHDEDYNQNTWRWVVIKYREKGNSQWKEISLRSNWCDTDDFYETKQLISSMLKIIVVDIEKVLNV